MNEWENAALVEAVARGICETGGYDFAEASREHREMVLRQARAALRARAAHVAREENPHD